MNRYRAFAAAIVAVLSLGVTAVPANAAVLGRPHANTQAHKSKVSPKAVRKVVREIGAANRHLDNWATYAPRQLSGDNLATVLNHLAADKATLAAQAKKAKAAKSTAALNAIRAQVRQMNPQNYEFATNDVGNAGRYATYIANLAAKVQPGSEQADQLAAAQAQLPTIIARALAFTASTPKAEVDAVQVISNGVLDTITAVGSYIGTHTGAP